MNKIINQEISEEMKTAYLDYAMSVIIGRALPDARDGLKPVHRRILYSMWEAGLIHNKPFRKSANVVGMCMAKYHPHGDMAIYDTLVRMAQDFSLRYPLVQGQGNFGSIDGDSPAAMRYTEARMSKIGEELLFDINKETVDFVPNFDGSTKEPSVLPAKIPNLLINGSSGIAVGMATNIPPHNLKDVCSGIIHRIKNPESSISDIIKIIPGPDFPTGGTIIGRQGILKAYTTGKGIIKIRSKYHQETVHGRTALVIDEIPYMVNKASMITQIADLVKNKTVEGIHDIRDETDRHGIRVVIELKKDASYEVVEAQLLKHSKLQVSFGINLLAILDKKPVVLNILKSLDIYIEHRINVIKRRTAFDLKKAKDRLHILEGLIIALNNLDAIIKLIKSSKSVKIAKESLITDFELSEIQAQAVLDLKLQKLTNLEQDKIKSEHKKLLELIKELTEILNSEEKVKTIIINELNELIDNYGDERKTNIIESDEEIDLEDLIESEDQVVIISASGYIKRMPLESYKLQKRGGKGVIGMQTKEQDFIEDVFIANTKSYLLCFTKTGKVHWLKVYRIPESSRQSKGKAIINLLNIENDSITSIIPISDFSKGYLTMITKKGIVKKTEISLYSKPRKNGIIAINLVNDEVITVLKTTGEDNIMIATKKGQAIKFNEQEVRPVGRNSIGVKGIKLTNKDEVIGAIIANDQETVFTITENGYGKRTKISEYSLIHRAGKGVRNIICSSRNGNVVAIKRVNDNTELIIMSKQGQVIRLLASQISVIGRNTQGVRIMKLKLNDIVTSVARIQS